MIKLCSYLVLTVLIADLLATSGDIAMTWTSPIFPKLYSNDTDTNPFDGPITADEESWIGSLVNIGSMIGPFPYSFLAEKFGRKIALLTIAIPHIISYITLAFSRSIYLYYFARLLGGLAVGGGYTLLPIYIAEISEDKYRGMLSTTLNMFWGFGNLLPYVIGPYIPIIWFNIILACVPVTFFILFLLIGTESPYYLIKKDKMEKARNSLKYLRSHQPEGSVDEEIDHIKAVLAHDQHDGHIIEIFKHRVLSKALIIALVLIIAQQLSGITVLCFYTQLIFEAAGTDIPADLSAMVGGLALFISSFICPIFVDKFGRRILLLISAIGMTFGHLFLGAFFYLKDNTDVNLQPIFWLPVVSLIVYIFTFNIGFGPLPWTVSSELFPTSVKSAACSIVSCTCWISAFLTTKFYNDLNYSLGRGGTFWMFGGCCAVTAVFVYFVLPETKGKSFKEIQESL